MNNHSIFAIAAIAAIASTLSCNKEITTDVTSVKEPLSFVATGEAHSKVNLDFKETANVRWLDDDLIAVFDGTAMNEFSIVADTNTGATATFSGEVTAGATNLYAVYPYSAAGSLSSSNLTVTVPSSQTIGSSTNVDPAALVSVGVVDDGRIEFKQVCALLRIQVTTSLVRSIVVTGNSIAGTATVAGSTGVLSSVSSASDTITLTYEGDVNFPKGTYYVAVLPGTTAAGSFSIQLVSQYGATSAKTASSAVTFQRCKGLSAGDIDGRASYVRHITNKAELYAWGEVMGEESGVTVYIDNDIDCQSAPWTYSASFNGVLEGQNHKIYNFIAQQTEGACMFGSLTGSIKNLIIGSSNGTSWDNVSTFKHTETGRTDVYVAPVALLGDGASMSNVTNFAKVEVTSASDSKVYLGGLVGLIGDSMSATMTGCKNYGNIVNSSTFVTTSDGIDTRMGGIMAQCKGVLTANGLENHGDLTSTNTYNSFIGGLCGDLGAGSEVTGSEDNMNINYGAITVTGVTAHQKYIGGLFGSIRGSTIQYCKNEGTVSIAGSGSSLAFIGGIVGMLESGSIHISNCSTIKDKCLVSCNYAGRTFLGGILGGARSANIEDVTISGCKNHAAVTNEKGASDVGGIAGQIWTSNSSAVSIMLSNCENTGTISSTFAENSGGNNNNLNIGGIFGQLDPDANSIHTVSGCKNSGTISATGALNSSKWVSLGGIGGVGGKKVTVIDCENTGSGSILFNGKSGTINQPLYAGGIMGNFSTSNASRYITVESCVNKGGISSNRGTKANYVGGIVGQTNTSGYGSVKDCVNYASLSVTSDVTATRVGGVIGKNHCTASGNSNYASVSDGTSKTGAGSCSGALAGENSATLSSMVVCDAVTVCGTPYSSASDKAAWMCPNDTGSIGYTLTAHSSTEGE